jgi:hypothetical protein
MTNNMHIRAREMLWIALACILILCLTNDFVLSMDLGTNFWNLGWHKSSDCFKDVKNVTVDDPWNPQFLKEISIYRSFRFMDWDVTNNSKRERWWERTAKNAVKQIPVAYEWMIDLCNRMNADMWVTIPHRTISHSTGDAPADYALRLCILIKTGVDMKDVDLTGMLDKLSKMDADSFIRAGGVKTCEPLKADLKLYVEYSNETWNGMFKQAHYCCDEGEALGLSENRWTAGFRYHAWAAIRLFRAADLVFGADSDRTVKVLATQTSNSWIAGQHQEVMNDSSLNPWNVKADAIATAPYFGHNVVGDSADAAKQLRAAIEKSAEQSARHKEIADKTGLKLIAYEGGQHVYKKAKAINLSPVMYELYQEYLDRMAEYFSHFSHYCHVGQAGDRGSWGCIEYTGQPLTEAHKYRALLEWSQKENSTASSASENRLLRILWLGSSSTYFHDAPRDAADWITKADNGLAARSYLIGRSGTAVYKYLEPDYRFEYGLKQGQSVLENIRREKYDFVILQVPTDYLAGRGDNDSDAFVEGLHTYIRVIRESGAKPIFYQQGWGDDDLFEAGDELLFKLVCELEVPVAPCRSAWKRIRSERPDLELHNLPDRTHPGTLGKYLNLCCFYALITGKSPVGLPYRKVGYWPRLSDEQKKQAGEKLKKMTISDEYVAGLAGWMQRNSISTQIVVLDKDVVEYFQNVAWETYKHFKTSIESSRFRNSN